MQYHLEERKEVCTVASKFVTLKIYRLPTMDEQGTGEIVDFQCNQSSVRCESRCTYRLLLNDF